MLGTGPVSQQFSAALKRVPGATLQAAFSRDANHAQRFARQYGFQRSSELNPSIFEAEDIDVFYIATPTVTHRYYCLAAINAGKHVLCEKPMTSHAGELIEVIEAARKNGVFIMEGMWLRFNPIIHMCREVLAKGQVGDILSVQMHVGYAEQAINIEVRDGIGRDALSIFGCYGFSIAHFLFGNPLTVHSSGRMDEHGSILHANVVLTYPSFEFQANASIVATLSNTLEIVGSKGVWRISNPVLDPCYSRWLPHDKNGATSKIINKLKAVYHTIQDELSVIHPLRGSGFRNEIEQVNISINNKQMSNATNPLEATMACHHIQAAARNALNLISPQNLKPNFLPPCKI